MARQEDHRGFVFVLLTVCVGVIFLGKVCAREPDLADLARRADSDARVAAQLAVEAQLRDPGSVQYRNTSVRVVADSQRVVCGEANSKNGFGGYAGFQRFVVTGQRAFLESQSDRKSFALTWKTLCLQ